MNSAPAPAANGDPFTTESPPVLLTAKAETLADPELLTKAKLVVVPGAVGGLPFMLQPVLRRISAAAAQAQQPPTNHLTRCPSEIMEEASSPWRKDYMPASTT
jgi:hypothetical protein